MSYEMVRQGKGFIIIDDILFVEGLWEPLQDFMQINDMVRFGEETSFWYQWKFVSMLL